MYVDYRANGTFGLSTDSELVAQDDGYVYSGDVKLVRMNAREGNALSVRSSRREALMQRAFQTERKARFEQSPSPPQAARNLVPLSVG